jgi:hypothetical protein
MEAGEGGHGPRALDSLRNVSSSWLRLAGWDNIAQGLRRFALRLALPPRSSGHLRALYRELSSPPDRGGRSAPWRGSKRANLPTAATAVVTSLSCWPLNQGIAPSRPPDFDVDLISWGHS